MMWCVGVFLRLLLSRLNSHNTGRSTTVVHPRLFSSLHDPRRQHLRHPGIFLHKTVNFFQDEPVVVLSVFHVAHLVLYLVQEAQVLVVMETI